MTEQIISPTIYIPKKNVIMDATILTALMNCEEYLNLRFNYNYVPITGTGNPLNAGILVHLILQEYNIARINGKGRDEAISIGMQAGQKFYTEEATNIPLENELHPNGHIKNVGYNYAVQTMELYFERWKNSHWTPIEAEKVVGAVVYEDDEIRVLYKAKIDLTVDTYNDGIAPVDYKTMKQKKNLLSLNNQFRGQAILTKSSTVYIERIGWQKSLEPEQRFTRQPMSFSREILQEQLMTIGYYAKTMVALHESGYYPHRFTFCDKWGGCIFRDVCSANPSDRQRVLNDKFIVGKEWDPGNEIRKNSDDEGDLP